MAIPVFPNIQQPSYPLKNKVEDVSLQSTMESGITISRPKFTRARETFTLQWNALPAADFYLLRTFYKTAVYGGSQSFQWTYPQINGDPYSGQAFSVRFTGGVIEFTTSSPGYYSGGLVIQED